MLVSPEALARVFLFFLYVPVMLFCYWRLIPRLSLATGLLATVMLVAQALLVLAGLEYQPRSVEDWWHWHLSQEGNIPARFATAQLTLVALVALATAWLAGKEPYRNRLFLTAYGLLFLFLAWEEYVQLRHHVLGREWVLYYAALGALVVAATLYVAARSPRRRRIWYLCLLAGLAMTAIGALAIEQFQFILECGSSAFARLERCLSEVYEEALEKLGVWILLVGMLGLFSCSAPKPRRLFGMIPFLLPILWLASYIGQIPVIQFEYWFFSQRASILYESKGELAAYRVQRGHASVNADIFWKVATWRDYSGLGYSLHLVDQASGASVAGQDDSANRLQSFRFRIIDRAAKHYYYKQSLTVDLPPGAAVNRALWIALTVWREEGDAFTSQKIVSSDLPLLGDLQVVLGELVLPDESPAPVAPPLAEFDNGFALGAVDLPGSARPGEILSLAMPWSASEADNHDYAQFLHFRHEESGSWWVHDQQPLGARLPTRLWYKGLADYEPWDVPLPRDLAPGRYSVFTGLYRLTDLQRLPARDAGGKPYVDARVPLGHLTLE